MHRYTIDSPFAFGDRIKFNARHASGEGVILDIAFSDDGTLYYMVLRDDDGEIEGGIHPDNATLIVNESAG